MADQTQSRKEQTRSANGVYDYRYRNSNYFLQDQLRNSEAVQDFQSVRNLLSKSPQFTFQNVFRMALQPVTLTD